MTFRVTARTLLHLGAELISSDGIALYELIKNAYDARSPRVTIDIVVRLREPEPRQLGSKGLIGGLNALGDRSDNAARTALEEIRTAALQLLVMDAPDAKSYRRALAEAHGADALADVIRRGNYILVSDSGHGMSLRELRDVYLTIGTRSRLEQRDTLTSGDKPLLGEKGLGRLSAMRLGELLTVETTRANENYWNVLDVDWTMFSHSSDALIDSIQIDPRRGRRKDDPAVSGTRIRISDLNSTWTKARTQQLAYDELTKITDPFTAKPIYPIVLRFNEDVVPIDRLDRNIFKHAHATLAAQFTVRDNAPHLGGVVTYLGRELHFAADAVNLVSLTQTPSVQTLLNLGPFDVELYWYNRRIMKEIEGIGDKARVQKYLREWGGGLMVFRDGFRVLPYGGPDDDWLNLDKKAFGSGGYKVNRHQILGRVNLSSVLNPALNDQTNREGLRDSPEKAALIKILEHVIGTELKTFLQDADAANKASQAREPASLDEIEERVNRQGERLRSTFSELVRRVPDIRREPDLMTAMTQSAGELEALVAEVGALAESYEQGRGQLLTLAGIGLAVEVLAHELTRATDHALATLADLSDGELPAATASLIRTLKNQLKTLQKRLRILDPLSVSGRQRKETFDVVELVRDTLSAHQAQFERERIHVTLTLVPKPTRVMIQAVRGMVVQVLENFIANSVYWLLQQRKLDPSHYAKLTVTIDTVARELAVTDSGPGVPHDLVERVFQPFFTTKPPGQGRGLGLFIAREIARYHGVDVFIADAQSRTGKTHHTFVLTLPGTKA